MRVCVCVFDSSCTKKQKKKKREKENKSRYRQVLNGSLTCMFSPSLLEARLRQPHAVQVHIKEASCLACLLRPFSEEERKSAAVVFPAALKQLCGNEAKKKKGSLAFATFFGVFPFFFLPLGSVRNIKKASQLK